VTFNICARSWKKPLDELLRATKNHLEEDEDGLGWYVPDGFKLDPIIKTK
jgi:hypothetical protein